MADQMDCRELTGKAAGGKQPRLLFVGPPVFGYHQSIISALERRGYLVTWWDDRASKSSLYKLALRLSPQVIAERSTAHFIDRLQQIDSARLSNVLVIKGESFSRAFLAGARQLASNARFSMYLWDSTENARGATGIAPLFDTVSTFDPIDAARHGWRYRPLFTRRSADIRSLDRRPRSANYDWSFIGTLHSDRHKVLYRIIRQNPGLRHYIFGYAPSTIALAARYLSDWSLWIKPPDRTSSTSLPTDQVDEIRDASRAVVDIEHPRQRGLTMRTIETLLSGNKLITTNRSIIASDLFHPSRIHVISREAPTIPAEFLSAPFKPIEPQVREQYALDRWIDDVIGHEVPGPAGQRRTDLDAL